MYGLVPYNLSPIQQAIQFGHAVVEYGIPYLSDRHKLPHPGRENYINWAKYWKTFIILNGGTSNHSKSRYENPFIDVVSDVSSQITPSYEGSMEKNLRELLSNGIQIGSFYEPDLNDMLSAIVFLVDERVFNKEKYPDFIDWYEKNASFEEFKELKSKGYLFLRTEDEVSKFDTVRYCQWVDFIGGAENLFLRSFLRNFRLA